MRCLISSDKKTYNTKLKLFSRNIFKAFFSTNICSTVINQFSISDLELPHLLSHKKMMLFKNSSLPIIFYLKFVKFIACVPYTCHDTQAKQKTSKISGKSFKVNF